MKIKTPYLLFVGDAFRAKTAFGVRDWRPEQALAQYRYPNATVDLELPDMDFEEAVRHGARTMLIGSAPAGGLLPQAWIEDIVAALHAGLDIASGLHTKLRDNPRIRSVADELGRALWDVRHPNQTFHIGAFERRSGKRLLTVGTDCAVGKKYTALAIEKALRMASMGADFRATGQTGILIAGEGVAIDSVVADFISAAAAEISPATTADHWDIIEGQGSLFHPAYAGVTLGLIHGSQPDAMVLCADPSRSRLGDFELYPQPGYEEAIVRYTEAARLTNPAAQVIGLSLNTSSYSDEEAREIVDNCSTSLGLPCTDPIRFGVQSLVTNLLNTFP